MILFYNKIIEQNDLIIIYIDENDINDQINILTIILFYLFFELFLIIVIIKKTYLNKNQYYIVYFEKLYNILIILKIIIINDNDFLIIIFINNQTTIRFIHEPRKQLNQYILIQIIERFRIINRRMKIH